MKLLYALPLALLAGACAHTPEPAVQTITVEVPVPVPCMTEGQLSQNPEPPLVGGLIIGTPEAAERDRDTLAASALRLRAWGKTLFAAHKACSE